MHINLGMSYKYQQWNWNTNKREDTVLKHNKSITNNFLNNHWVTTTKPLSNYHYSNTIRNSVKHSYPIKTKYQRTNRLDSSTDLASKLITALCTEQTLLSLMQHKMGLKACHSTTLLVAFRTLQNISLLVKCLVQHKVWLEINEYRQFNFLVFDKVYHLQLLTIKFECFEIWPRCSKNCFRLFFMTGKLFLTVHISIYYIVKVND